MFRSALDPPTVFKAFQEKVGRFAASASRAVIEARGLSLAALRDPLSKGEAPRQNFKLRHYRLAVHGSGETWRIVTFLTITRDGKGPVPNFRV
jgi:hypothetical protein